jgi:hypothetical protein
MIFEERKMKTKWEYICRDDVLGKVRITSKERLNDPDYLDQVFSAIWDVVRKNPKLVVKGDVKNTSINYYFYKKNPWQKTTK